MGVGTTRGAIQTVLDGVIAHRDLSPDQILSARIKAAYGVWAAARCQPALKRLNMR
jgi:hypothetical protein